jgi:hypothetical protein
VSKKELHDAFAEADGTPTNAFQVPNDDGANEIAGGPSEKADAAPRRHRGNPVQESGG